MKLELVSAKKLWIDPRIIRSAEDTEGTFRDLLMNGESFQQMVIRRTADSLNLDPATPPTPGEPI